MESQFERSFRAKLDDMVQGLFHDPGLVRTADEPTRRRVLQFLIESACQSQNIEAITLSNRMLAAAPRPWLLSNVEQEADDLLDLEDEYEYRRLLELYESLPEAADHLSRLVDRGLRSGDSDLAEAAEEFRVPPIPTERQPSPHEPDEAYEVHDLAGVL